MATLVAALTAGAASAQGGAQGDWLTEGGEGKVRIAPCPGQPAQLCGRLINPKTGAFVKGDPFITGFKTAGPNRWTGGKIRNPKDGKTYNSKMTLGANGALSVSGCVLMICQAQTWTRAPSSKPHSRGRSQTGPRLPGLKPQRRERHLELPVQSRTACAARQALPKRHRLSEIRLGPTCPRDVASPSSSRWLPVGGRRGGRRHRRRAAERA